MENILTRLTRGKLLNPNFLTFNKRRFSTTTNNNIQPNILLKHTVIVSLTLCALNNSHNNNVQ